MASRDKSHQQGQRPKSFPLQLEIPMSHFPAEYSPQNERPGKKVSTRKGREKASMLDRSDWEADMANNNIIEIEEDNGDDDLKKEGGQVLGSTTTPVIQLVNVSVRKERSDKFNSGTGVFTSLNFTFTAGRVFVIIGEPQSGKTALLQTLAKIRSPASGKVKYLGKSKTGNRLSSGLMAQKDGFFASLSPVENVQYFAKLYCIEPVVAHNKLHQLMTIIGWERKSAPMVSLNRVHQTLVSLALASLHSPGILLLDEPNFGADLFLKEHIWKQLKKLTRNESVTIIFATSTVEDVRFADEAAIIREKTLVPCVLSPEMSLGDDESPPKSLEPQADSSSVPPIDITGLLSVDVEKIRQFVATSYALQSETELDHENESNGRVNAVGKTNLAFFKSPSDNSNLHLEMSWSTESLAGKGKLTGRLTPLNRIHKEPNLFDKILLIFMLFLKLATKQPAYIFSQILTPAILVSILAYFIGQNPYDIPVAVFNPDQPSIVSRHVLNSMDKHTIHLMEYPTLESAIEAVKQHSAWAVIEFPANYTNSMINRALQNCENEEEDEPEAESISGHLIDSEAHHKQFEKLTTFNLPNSNDISKPVDKESEELARVYRARSRSRRSLEKEETPHEIDDASSRDSNRSTPSTPYLDEGREGHALGDDIDVNHKKLKPINLLTIRLHADNTNLLVAGFIKAKVFHALQKAQADPSLASLSPKIPVPLEMVSPNIYGLDETPMGDFLLPGTLVLVVFLSSAILPLPALTSIKQSPVYELIQASGIGRLLVVTVFTTLQFCILAVQIGLILLVVTLKGHPILGSILFSFGLLFLQGAIGILLSTLACFSINIPNPGLISMILHLHYFVCLIIFGGIYWPLECLPPKFRPIVGHLFPQAIGAESLRYVFSRGWGWERYTDRESNDVIWWAVNLPAAWILGLTLMVMVTVKFY